MPIGILRCRRLACSEWRHAHDGWRHGDDAGMATCASLHFPSGSLEDGTGWATTMLLGTSLNRSSRFDLGVR
jgi:hypothetical protein